VRAVEVTGSNIGDAPMLPELLNQIPSDQDIGSVTADGAYDTRKCHEAIAARDAHAVVPPRKNAKPWKPTSTGAIARNDAVNAQRYLGRTLWRRWSGYHRRSRVDTKMHCIKLLGQSLMARDFERQVAEIQSASPSSIATLLLVYLSQNLSARCAWGKGKNVLQPICATKPYVRNNLIGRSNNFGGVMKKPTCFYRPYPTKFVIIQDKASLFCLPIINLVTYNRYI